MRATLSFLLTSVFLVSISIVQAGDVHDRDASDLKPAVQMNLWPALAPGEKEGALGEEKAVPGKESKPIIRVSNVTTPTLSVFPADPEKATGTCVIIFPGGGYNILAYNHEGTEIAHWLNSIGVTAVVVKYRVPRRADREKHAAPLQDAQRAIRLVRGHAEQWKIRPNRIGILGFSAGAHLTLMAATQYDQNAYEPLDEMDKVNARPDFAAPIYLAYALGEKIDPKRVDLELEENIRVTKETPPMFLSIADDDGVGSMGSVKLYVALKQAGVPCELHVFVKGGHGYGIRDDRGPAARWNLLCGDWMKQIGMLKKPE